MKNILIALIAVAIPVSVWAGDVVSTIQHPDQPDLQRITVTTSTDDGMRGEIIIRADNVAVNPADGSLYKDVEIVREYDPNTKKYKAYKDFKKATKIDRNGTSKKHGW